jgi:hypothetical protein
MENHITPDSFKAQAKKMFAALKDRGIALKLSDVQESLAISYGYKNLAAMNGMLKLDASRVVPGVPLYKQPDNLFVISWVYNVDSDGDDLVVYAPGTGIDDIATRDWRKLCDLNDSAIKVPDDVSLNASVVLENFAEVSNISKYGLHDGAHEKTVNAWILEHFYFRVAAEGVKVYVSDRADDGASKDHFLIWVPDDVAQALKDLFQE